jgi:type VI secretion system protein
MPLTLRIISKQKDLLGADSTKVFSVHGGTIGRAPDNDWILPDPDRYVSAHHAIIDYQGGAYYLTDSSSNGVYVNDSDQSVGSGAPIRLHNGDRLRMGRYRFAVSIVNVGRDGTSDTGVFLAEDAEEDGEFTDTTTLPSPRADSLGLNLKLVDDAPAPRAEPEPTDTEQFTIIEAVPETMRTRILEASADDRSSSPADSAEETQPVEALQKESIRAALVALLEAAGADPDRLGEGQETVFIERLGQVIRAAVTGLAGSFEPTDRPAAPPDAENLARNPLCGNDENRLLNELLFYSGLDYAAPVDAVEEAAADVQAHQQAVTRAGRAAWLDLLDRMAPATLEAGFNKGLTRGSLLGISNKAKYWDLYREFYEQLARRADERFGQVFEETYRRIYQAERNRRNFREERQAVKEEEPTAATDTIRIPD